mmetsp:Transcript_10586/g.17059  ORF Transcript_10586/g.17059 Transcript_10586/m.17059 type:complete len:239 (+) Transcript_10586:121-837(+)
MEWEMRKLLLLVICLTTTPLALPLSKTSKAAVSPNYRGVDYPRERYRHHPGAAAFKCHASHSSSSDDESKGGGAMMTTRGKKWATRTTRNGDFDENLERFESIKSAVVGAIVGSIASAPIALLSPNRLTAQWEFDHDALALSLALSALVYRYAVREDPNPMLKQGVVGAFAITRILALLQVSNVCTSLPLSCGAPLGIADWNMIGRGLFIAAESFIAFGAVAVALEILFDRGLIKRFP